MLEILRLFELLEMFVLFELLELLELLELVELLELLLFCMMAGADVDLPRWCELEPVFAVWVPPVPEEPICEPPPMMSLRLVKYLEFPKIPPTPFQCDS